MPIYDAQQTSELDIISADWPAPSSIVACSTTRSGGVSEDCFRSLNLAQHVNDDALQVAINRQLLANYLQLPSEPQWLQQTHSINVLDLDTDSSRDGDAAMTSIAGQVAVVLTADCLPVLFCNRQGTEVAAAHAGWKGLLKGVLEQTVIKMNSRVEDLIAWMGPAIGASQFEVGAEIPEAFMQHDTGLENCFTENRTGHYLANLYAIAKIRLKKQGVSSIYGGEYCTFTEKERFFSYRREKVTGRQASLIYIKK